MSLFLENVKKLYTKSVIDGDQLLFLIFVEADVPFPITAPKLKKLVTLGYIKSGKIGKELFKEMDDVVAKGTISPIYSSDISKQVVERLCRLLCVKKDGTLYVSGNDDEPVKTTAERYLGGEFAIAYHYLIFLFLFPSDKDPNLRWEKHFLGTKYTGMPLRIRSKSTGKKFKTMAKTKDMGAFLLGTYRYIKSVTKGDKAFVTTIPKYLTTYEDWYDQAYDEIQNAESVEELFKITGEDTGLMNVVI